MQQEKVKFSFQVFPLPVYVGDHMVKLLDIEDMLRGALVEVSFKLRHFCFKNKGEDSFNATAQQVLILQLGIARPANAFK